MITTAEIPPAPALAPFIRCYTFRELDTKGANMTGPWHANNEISIQFFFKAVPLRLIGPQGGTTLKEGTYCDIIGLGTQYNGEMTFNGTYAFFGIAFKAGGFDKIFNISSGDFVNQVVSADALFNADIKILYEQLCTADGIKEMASFADTFLLAYLKKHSSVDYKDAIIRISNLIRVNAGLVNIDQLAYEANMSRRNFERHFTERMGMPPKLFCCITRFNHALSFKLQHPGESWTSIALSCGYFDQMHLIKEFKRFSGNVPSAFLKQTPLVDEHFTARVEG